MECEQENYGIASPKVELLSALPNVNTELKRVLSFDISAFDFPRLQDKSNAFAPINTQYIKNHDGTFAACFPSLRKYHVDNLISSTDTLSSSASPPKETISWKPISLPAKPSPKSFNYFELNIFSQGYPSYYVGVPTTDPKSRQPQNTKTDDYRGPIWRNTNYNEEARPNDDFSIDALRRFLEGVPPTDIEPPPDAAVPDPPTFASPWPPSKPTDKEPVVSRTSALQTEVLDGLWWGLESDDFISEPNMPFGVTIEVPTEPPPDYDFPTVFSIVFGDKKNKFELFMKLGLKPVLHDYDGIAGGNEGDDNKIEIGSNLSLQAGEFGTGSGTFKGRIDVGFMTCGARLIIFVNNDHYVYTRLQKDPKKKNNIGEIKECKISQGGIKVFGTNTVANVYAYPLSFAKQAFMCFNYIPYDEKLPPYSAAGKDGKPTDQPVAVFPSGGGPDVYGVDCRTFSDSSPRGSISIPEGFGVHSKEGTEIEFFELSKFFSKSKLDPKYAGTDYFILSMTSSDFTGWRGGKVQFGRTPYFFKLKGVTTTKVKPFDSKIIDISEDIMSVSEKSSAPDYFHVAKSANLTLYNKDGKYNYLADTQFGIRISWAWNKDKEDYKTKGKHILTFTGIITSMNFTNVPGKEEVSVSCQDYMHILENVPIVNSPIYDGMLAVGVLKDLGERAGILTPITSKKWKSSTTAYFLPSGYTFTSPKYRFAGDMMIKECMIKVSERFESYFYFDGSGRMVIEKLPGGLLGFNTSAELKSSVGSNKFTSLPDPEPDRITGKTPYTIFDQREIEFSYASTSNKISTKTLDRDTRDPVFYAIPAKERDGLGVLAFRKPLLLDEAALGGLDEAEWHTRQLAKRVFYPIRKMNFKTIDEASLIEALDFVSVDGKAYRIISIDRSYESSKNYLISNYQGEWLYGRVAEPIL